MRENLAHVFQEQAELFFDSQADSYAIMQLDSSKVTPFEPFSSLRLLGKYGLKPNAEHYNIVYTDTLPAYQNIHVFLESVYSRFNIDRPEDFKGHSLSVSDIVAIRQAGVVSCYYCDSVGFQKLDMVLEPESSRDVHGGRLQHAGWRDKQRESTAAGRYAVHAGATQRESRSLQGYPLPEETQE